MKIQSKAALLMIAAVVVAVGAICTKVAEAGYKNDYDVVLSDAGRYAQGSLGTTRAMAGDRAYIAIELDSNASGSSAYVWARNAAGTVRVCFIGQQQEGMLATARAAIGDSYVHVTWDTIGTCTSLLVENSSHLRPKTL